MTPFAERVLDVVDAIPAARVMSYGDIAEYLGEGGPRQVGRVMALWGGGVPWWRVIHADGSPPPGHDRAALARYRAEGTPLRTAPARGLPASGKPRGTGHGGVPDGPVRVDMARARWRGPGRPVTPALPGSSAGREARPPAPGAGQAAGVPEPLGVPATPQTPENPETGPLG